MDPFFDYSMKLETIETTTTYHSKLLQLSRYLGIKVRQHIKLPSLKLSTQEKLHCVLEQDSSVIRCWRTL